MRNLPKVEQIMVTADSVNLYSYKDHENKVLYLNTEDTIHFTYWATWCLPCVNKLDSLNNTNSNFKNQYFVTYENSEVVNSFCDKKNYKLPIFLLDSTKVPFKPVPPKAYPSKLMITNGKATLYNHD